MVTLADASGNLVASYTCDEFGIPLSSGESFPGGWTNPYRCDGRDDVRADWAHRHDRARAIVGMSATHASRWYISTAFTTFLIFWMLLY